MPNLIQVMGNDVHIKDPVLWSYKHVGYSELLKAFLIFNEIEGKLLAISAHNAEVIKIYQLPASISEIKISNSGEYIAWRLKTGEFSFMVFPFEDYQIGEKFKSWRKISSQDDKQNLSAGELYLSIRTKLDKLEFSSSHSKNHQLNPWNFSLSIPDTVSLKQYDVQNAINALIGKNNKNLQPGNTDVETIYHELFHVFQSNSTAIVFDYFETVDSLQLHRAYLLKYLSETVFFELLGDSQLEQCKSIFHFLDYCKDQNIKFYGNACILGMERLIEYFNTPKDLEIHTFHLIEGSAEVFGLCCGGYDAFAKIELDIENQGNELYFKAYQLFKENGGKTPLVFIILCLAALKCGVPYASMQKTPADIFIWGLEKVKNWESDFNVMVFNQEIDEAAFKSIAYQLVDQITNTIAGNFSAYSNNSTRDKKESFYHAKEESIFMQTLGNIRNTFKESNDLSFLVDLVLNKQVAYDLADKFNADSEQMKAALRIHQVVRDYDSFLINEVNYPLDSCGADFKIYCCPTHKEVSSMSHWNLCEHKESFKNILLNEFGITPSARFLM